MTITDFLQRINGVKQTKLNHWEGCCPAHDDQKASLCISEGNDGNILIKCQAGCPTEYVVSKLGLKLSDLFSKTQKQQTPSPQKRLIKTYDYVDNDGNLLYQQCRFQPKGFAQRRPDPNKPKEWLWNIDGVERVLYCLPEVISAIKDDVPIFICEGEKAVDSAKTLGFTATCSPGGAGKWKDSYTQSLKGAICFIIPDNDEPGREHAGAVEKSLRGVAASVRIVELPGLPRKGDIFDFVESRDAQDLESIRNEIIALTQKTDQKKPPETLSDLTNADEEKFYYEKHSKEYLLRNQRKSWMSLSESQFKKELAHRGMNSCKEKGENVSEVDEFIINLRDTKDIDYSGPLAGYTSGFYEMNGFRVLVTESPQIIQPSVGDWPTLEKLIHGLLLDENHDQQLYLFGWLKLAYESLIAGYKRPGQVLAICGPHNCGKSLLQLLITKILGGRSAKPYSFMTAITDFNGELFTAEHLMIEDEPASTDLRTRRNFGAQIKQIAGCDVQRCHAKNHQAISLTPFWRLSITLNDEAENLMVLPPIDNSIEDKIIILKAVQTEMPMPTDTNEARSAFWNTLISELPAFLYYLTKLEIPKEIKHPRYGISHFHHPTLLQEIDALSPEFRLLSIIDKDVFGTELPVTWTGTAEDLEVFLTTKGTFQYESRKLLSWNNATGTYLGRLAKKYPSRFSQERSNVKRVWTIDPPQA
jgi:hypothetical protein